MAGSINGGTNENCGIFVPIWNGWNDWSCIVEKVSRLIFSFSHLFQVTSDLGSNPGGVQAGMLDFDVRGANILREAFIKKRCNIFYTWV